MLQKAWSVKIAFLLSLVLGLPSCSGHNPSETENPSSLESADPEATGTLATDDAPTSIAEPPPTAEPVVAAPTSIAVQEDQTPVTPKIKPHVAKNKRAHTSPARPKTKRVAAPAVVEEAPVFAATEEPTDAPIAEQPAIVPSIASAPVVAAPVAANEPVARSEPIAAASPPALFEDRQPTNVQAQAALESTQSEPKNYFTYIAIGALVALVGFWFFRKRKA